MLGKIKKLLSLSNMYIDREYDEWITLSCPLAYKYHADGMDKHPSAGISISRFPILNCFVCGNRPLISVLINLFFDGKLDKSVLVYYLENFITEELEIKKLSISSKFKYICKYDSIVPDSVLKCMLPLCESKIGMRFLSKRGINPAVCDGVYVYKDSIVFPIRNLKGQVVGLHARALYKKKYFYLKPKHFNLPENTWNNTEYWWFRTIDVNKPLILVEGILDALKLNSFGINNVLASCGSVGKKKIEFVRKLNPTQLYLGFDCDLEGRRYTQKFLKYFPKSLVIDWGLVGCKDACDIKDTEGINKVIKHIA